MKTRTFRHIVTTSLIAGLAFISSGTTAAPRTHIDSVDNMSYDGRNLSITYTISSHCPAAKHTTEIEFDPVLQPYRSTKKVVRLDVKLYDTAPETKCDYDEDDVTIEVEDSLTDLIRDEIKELSSRYVIDPDMAVGLPYVSARAGNPGAKFGDSGPGGKPGHPHTPPQPSTVHVVNVSYEPTFKCLLYKNDGARKDGFTGTGSTMDEARRNAAKGCRTTNNPKCELWSKDPAHTSCDIKMKEKYADTVVPISQIPTGATLSAWSCNMQKGPRGESFSAIGNSENEARGNVIDKCSESIFSGCDAAAKDTSNTICAPAYVKYAPKPEPVWTCVLYKNDGARKDGFTGTGSTEQEARRNTIPGCKRTNNPNCSVWANDPTHTACDLKFR